MRAVHRRTFKLFQKISDYFLVFGEPEEGGIPPSLGGRSGGSHTSLFLLQSVRGPPPPCSAGLLGGVVVERGVVVDRNF